MIEVHGHKIYAPFIFVCDGKVYSSHSGTRWSVNFTRYGTKAWGNTTWAEQDVTRACPDGRNSEVNAAFRKVIKGHFHLKDNQIASFLKQQAEEKKQILVEGKSVKRHISSGNNGSASTQPAPVETPLPETALGTLIKALIKRGCPENRVMEYMEWEKQQQLTGKLTGVKLNVRLKMFLGTWEEPAPVVEPQPEPTPEPKRSLVEEREHREDVPFYGRRRRDQASFRSDVALNCGDRCVYTGASAIRCEAAHLVAHARKGGASFKNGLLLRADLHTLFDAGLCAIDPATLQIWFSAELLESDADLQRINGAKMRPTTKPINSLNLVERWEAFKHA